jgi:hypothetical protein
MTAVIERPLVYAAGKPPPFTQTGDAPAAPDATEQEETEEED